jgi:molybdopterin-guanine dinucleotide biosynthesis protein A
VILAGGSVKPDLQAQFGIPSKGMIPLLGRIAADFVVDAARACPGIGKVALAGPEAYRDLPVMERVDAFVPDTGRIPANLLAAMVALGEEQGRGLMVAGDSPLLTGEALAAFLSRVPEDADLCYPAVSKQGVMAAFPERAVLPRPPAQELRGAGGPDRGRAAEAVEARLAVRRVAPPEVPPGVAVDPGRGEPAE